jgi:hypothetical protein
MDFMIIYCFTCKGPCKLEAAGIDWRKVVEEVLNEHGLSIQD